MKRLLALVLIALALTVPAAHADEAVVDPCSTGDYSIQPSSSLCWPVAQDTVVIEGPANIWRMRVFAQMLDAQLTGLSFIVSGTCAEHPEAFCVRVEKRDVVSENHDDGLASWNSSENGVLAGGTILLRRHCGDRVYRRGVAAHELMHLLGFQHHVADGGIVGPAVQQSDSPTPSAGEWALLHNAYDAQPVEPVEQQDPSTTDHGL